LLLKNPRGYRASPNGVLRAFKELIQLSIGMVKKKTPKWRLCVNFRQINAKFVKDAYPMSRISYILDKLREARYISSLDLRDGSWKIPLEKSSRK